MGDDGFDLTKGYCAAGEFPSFEIIKENGISYKLKRASIQRGHQMQIISFNHFMQMIFNHLNFQ